MDLYGYYNLCSSGQIIIFHQPELRPFGDDFPKINHDSSEVAVRSL